MNECDWLDQVLGDIEDMSKEILAAQTKSANEYAVLSRAIRASGYPATPPAEAPNLPRRGAAAAALTTAARQLTTKTDTLMAALKLLAVGVEDLKKCCPPSETPPAAALSTLTVVPSSVVGGRDGAQGTVTLDRAAPASGAMISLASSRPFAKVPPSVTVPAGNDRATFIIATTRLFETRLVAVITASYNGVSKTASITVVGTSNP